MYTIKTVVLAFAAFAATAAAAPQAQGQAQNQGQAPQGGKGQGQGSHGSVSVKQAQEQCNGNANAQELHCCESESSDGLLSVLDDLSILGGQCSQISIPIAILGTVQSDNVQQFCSNNQVACCPAGTEGSSTGCSAISSN